MDGALNICRRTSFRFAGVFLHINSSLRQFKRVDIRPTCLPVCVSVPIYTCYSATLQSLIFRQRLARLLCSTSQFGELRGQAHRVGETGKKSISQINLAHLATLARLIWINEMVCCFHSACCHEFRLIFADIALLHLNLYLNECVCAWCGGGACE